MLKALATGVMGCVLLAAITSKADFVQPTDQQLLSAAADPSQIGALLKDASTEQAAQVLKAVVVKVLGLGLDPQAVLVRVASVVTSGFNAMPVGSRPVLSSQFGSVCAVTTVINVNAAVVSTIQGSIVSVGGGAGSSLGEAFGKAYTETLKRGAANANNKESAPPVTTGYEGQD